MRTESGSSGKWWLIRYRDQSVSRPLPEAELIEKIERGVLDQRDEICVSEGYWFSVQDVAEVRKFLGDIKLDRPGVSGVETSTTIPGVNKGLGQVRTAQEPASYAAAKVAEIKKSKASDLSLGEGQAFELPEEEPSVSFGKRFLWVLILALIFSGTVYLLWSNSKK